MEKFFTQLISSLKAVHFQDVLLNQQVHIQTWPWRESCGCVISPLRLRSEVWQKNGTILGIGRGKFDYIVGKRKEEEEEEEEEKTRSNT